MALAALSTLPLAAAEQEQRAELLMRAAIHKETVEGDLKGAIDQYKKALGRAGANRALAARALMRMGQCYEKLGDLQARGAYEKLVRDYADQREIAAEARGRLTTLARPRPAGPGAIAFRQIFRAGADMGSFGSPSPDGRYLPFTDWTTADLAIRDLATGENRRLTNKAKESSPGMARGSLFSPNGRQLAYVWWENGEEIRLVGVDGSGVRTIHKAGQDSVLLQDWSPDGSSILASVVSREGAIQLLLISLPDGKIRLARKLDQAGYSMKFSPDGRFIAYVANPTTGESRSEIRVLSVDGSRDIVLLDGTAHDLILGWAGKTSQLLFASDRAGAFDIWTQAVVEGKPQRSPRLLKQGAGRIRPLGFTRNGAFYYELNTSMTDIYIVELDMQSGKAASAPRPVTRRLVGGNRYAHWSPDGKSLLYWSTPPVGNRVLIVQDFQSGKEREVRPALREFRRPAWRPDGKAIIVFGTGGDSRRGFYSIDPQSGEAALLVDAQRIEEVMADAAWSRDGKTVFAYSRDRIYRLNLESGDLQQLFSVPEKGPLDVALLSLSPDESQLVFQVRNFPRGEVSLRAMPVTGGDARVILRQQYPEQFHCCRSLAWTADGRYVLAAQGRLGEEKGEIWLAPVNGGEPVKTGLSMQGLRGPHLHPDGRRVVFHAGDDTSEIWVMENFLPVIEAGSK